MCIICDGGSYDDLLFDQYAKIEKYGYTMEGVEGPDSWTYSIGLAVHDHPELVVTSLPFAQASFLVGSVADLVCAGRSFLESSPPLTIDGLEVRFGPVHPAQWEYGRFDGWLRYYDALGDHGWLKRDALQIIWPDQFGRYPADDEFCCNLPTCQPLLDTAPARNVHDDVGVNRRPRSAQPRGNGRRRRRRQHK